MGAELSDQREQSRAGESLRLEESVISGSETSRELREGDGAAS